MNLNKIIIPQKRRIVNVFFCGAHGASVGVPKRKRVFHAQKKKKLLRSAGKDDMIIIWDILTKYKYPL